MEDEKPRLNLLEEIEKDSENEKNLHTFSDRSMQMLLKHRAIDETGETSEGRAVPACLWYGTVLSRSKSFIEEY